MKKKPASQSAFFNLRILIGFAFCSVGVLLAVAPIRGDGNTANRLTAAHKNTTHTGTKVTIPTSNTWESISSMSVRRTHVAVTSGPDGVYALGGDTDRYVCSWGCGVTASTERYSAGTGSWSTLAPMNKKRNYFAAATGLDGRVYAIGGWTPDEDVTNTAEVYSPDTNSWAFIAAMPVHVAMEAATTGQDGRIYVLGGGPVMNQGTTTLLIYDPATNGWSYGPPMLEPLALLGAATGTDGRIYAIASNPEVYDPVSRLWLFIAPLPIARAYLGGAADRDDRIYALGGCCVPGALQEVDIYSPATNTWAVGPSMLVQRSTPGAAFGGDGRLYAVGGSDDTFNLRSAEVLDVGSGVNPVPLINQPLVPDATAPGGAGFTLTVNGTGFVSGSVVNWNGSARATKFVSNSELTAAILASDIATASTASVTVVNPSPGGGASNTMFFPIRGAASTVALSRSDITNSRRGTPIGIATGDFNRDGKVDLAVSYGCCEPNAGNTVAILLANGDGTFPPEVDYATAGEPAWVAVADLNGDGNLDLVTADYTPKNVSVLLGNGDGTFGAYTAYATADNSNQVIIGDFNKDGKLDLATINPGPNSCCGTTVSILLGNGDGTFQAHVDVVVGVVPTGIATGDFNRDGNLDLAVSKSGGSDEVSILLGNGNGTFQTPVAYSTGGECSGQPVSADFNMDGNLDLAVTNSCSATLSVLMGKGDGTFQPAVTYPTGPAPGGLTTADFNNDGMLDLMNHDSKSDTISLYLGNGDGTFMAAVNYPALIGGGPGNSASGDFNGDGSLDLALTYVFGDAVSIFLQSTTVTLSNTSLRFGAQLVGTASPAQEVTLTNTGPIPLTISSITASGDFFQRNNCGLSLPAGESCTIKVAFNPSAKGGRTGSVTITDNAADSPQTIKLKGTGTVVQVLPASLDFGDQVVGTTSDPLTATLTNIGSEDLHISGIAIGGANFGDFAETTTCGSRLPAGGSCTINVTFTPGARGQRQASLKIVDDGGASPQSVPLAGTGVRR